MLWSYHYHRTSSTAARLKCVWSIAGMPFFSHVGREKVTPPPHSAPLEPIKFCGSKTPKSRPPLKVRPLVFLNYYYSIQQAVVQAGGYMTAAVAHRTPPALINNQTTHKTASEVGGSPFGCCHRTWHPCGTKFFDCSCNPALGFARSG